MFVWQPGLELGQPLPMVEKAVVMTREGKGDNSSALQLERIRGCGGHTVYVLRKGEINLLIKT